MGARITAIRKAGGGSSRLAVYVDGHEAFRVSEQLAELLGLAVGRELAPDEYERLESDVELGRVKEAALRLLGVRARSAGELEDRLRRKGHAPEVIARVTTDLTEAGLIDDRAFAALWVDERMRLRPCGRMRLARELRAKRVAPALIEEALAEAFAGESETDVARRAAARRAVRLRGDPKARARLHSFLLRRGFTYEVAAQVTRELEDQLDEQSDVTAGDQD